MTESKHTAGPLSVQEEGECFVVQTEGGIVRTALCYFSPRNVDADRDLARADATLYAASPDLLEALQYVLSAHGEQLTDAFEQAHKAIAKATGETK